MKTYLVSNLSLGGGGLVRAETAVRAEKAVRAETTVRAETRGKGMFKPRVCSIHTTGSNTNGSSTNTKFGDGLQTSAEDIWNTFIN
jgi:hypothetical protein